ncbi:expressed unknown protein [Seminavis robusta]|uniref:Uncharacterized protein n=1 Tax=Seminavis robusta TaxID=568900 RepID=A0A9N8E7X8_9STRA|nr:expressed unknown protein [Seminavis robusta]|eukprot:Sro780_g201420.1 n/a (269) ;mRNA; f:9489-10295
MTGGTSKSPTKEMKMNSKTARLLSSLLFLTNKKHQKSNSLPEHDLDDTSAMSSTEEFSETSEFNAAVAEFSARGLIAETTDDHNTNEATEMTKHDNKQEVREGEAEQEEISQKEVAREEEYVTRSAAMFEFDVDELEELAGLDIDNLEDLLCLMGLNDEPQEESAKEESTPQTETPEIEKEEAPTTVQKEESKKQSTKKPDAIDVHGRFRDDILRRLKKQSKGTQAAYTPYTYGRNGLSFATEEEHTQAGYDDDEISRFSTSTVGLYY